MSRVTSALLIIAGLAGIAAFEYAAIVWLSGPPECMNCDPE